MARNLDTVCGALANATRRAVLDRMARLTDEKKAPRSPEGPIAMRVHPETDLQIERLIEARPEALWRCWAEPDLFKQWFVPAPVRVTACEIDLRAGGHFFTEMTLPDGSVMPSDGSFLLVERHRRLVFGDALQQGFRPTGGGFMTADITLTPQDGGTRYHAHVMHATAEARQQHLDMGFEDGWATTLSQLGALAQGL